MVFQSTGLHKHPELLDSAVLLLCVEVLSPEASIATKVDKERGNSLEH